MTIVNEKVLVTGGAGYIGSHTAKRLAQDGYIPVTIDNLVYGHRNAVQWGPLYETDISQKSVVKKIIKKENIKSVIHFAAYAYVGESIVNPSKYFVNNVCNTIKLLEAVLESGVNIFVFSSSCATYGIRDSSPITENDDQTPINPYGESKLFIEKILKRYGKAYGLKWAVLRYFNAAGAHPDGNIGELHDPETHLIPLAIAAAMGRHPPLKVFGNDYDTKDGTAVRDYIHVCDLAEAHIQALNALRSDQQEIALNLGTGTGYSVKEIIKVVEKVAGTTVPHKIVSRRKGDPPVLVADSTMARNFLGWTPQHSAINTMIETAFRFYQKIWGS